MIYSAEDKIKQLIGLMNACKRAGFKEKAQQIEDALWIAIKSCEKIPRIDYELDGI